MARNPLTPRQLELEEALANLKVEKAALRTIRGQAAAQQRRVRAAQQVLDQLSRCDWCGSKVLAFGAELQLCRDCAAVQRKLHRVEFLAQHGYGPDGKRLAAA
jgi:multidrug resistance efflux pump